MTEQLERRCGGNKQSAINKIRKWCPCRTFLKFSGIRSNSSLSHKWFKGMSCP
jgi:hypothetical protein